MKRQQQQQRGEKKLRPLKRTKEYRKQWREMKEQQQPHLRELTLTQGGDLGYNLLVAAHLTPTHTFNPDTQTAGGYNTFVVPVRLAW